MLNPKKRATRPITWIAQGLRGYTHRVRSCVPSGAGQGKFERPRSRCLRLGGLATASGNRTMVAQSLTSTRCTPMPAHGRQPISRATGQTPDQEVFRRVESDRYGDALPSARLTAVRPYWSLARQGYTSGMTHQDKELHWLQGQRTPTPLVSPSSPPGREAHCALCKPWEGSPRGGVTTGGQAPYYGDCIRRQL